MADLEQKLARARAQHDVAWSSQREAQIEAQLGRRRRRRRAVRLGVVASLLIAAGLVGTRLGRTPADVQTLADGSQITVAEGAAVTRRIDSKQRVLVELTRGRAHFSVTHDPTRPFRVEAGAAAVEVLGTEFTVERHADSTRVEVQVGRVAVFSEGRRRELTAGQAETFVRSPPVAEPPPERSPPEPPAAPAPTTAPRANEAAKPTPRTPAPAPGDEVARLLAAADRARQQHRPADAIAPLRRLLRDHADDAQAPYAAFVLGRVLLDDLDRPGEAADAFLRAQSPATPLAEDALAREIEAAARSGDKGRARQRGALYLQRFPDGPHRRAVAKWVDPE